MVQYFILGPKVPLHFLVANPNNHDPESGIHNHKMTPEMIGNIRKVTAMTRHHLCGRDRNEEAGRVSARAEFDHK